MTDAQRRAEEERQKKESLRVMMAYSKQEKGLFILGMFCLFLGQLSDLSIPLFIGMVIDLLVKEDYSRIYQLCIYVLAIVAVSPCFF